MKKRRNWSLLFDYIEYFEGRPKGEWAGGEKTESGYITMPYPVYSEKMSNFIQLVNKMGLTESNYLQILTEHGIDDYAKFSDCIESADKELLCAMLAFYIRQERFGGGFVGEAIENGNIAAILNRLQFLIEKKA